MSPRGAGQNYTNEKCRRHLWLQGHVKLISCMSLTRPQIMVLEKKNSLKIFIFQNVTDVKGLNRRTELTDIIRNRSFSSYLMFLA